MRRCRPRLGYIVIVLKVFVLKTTGPARLLHHELGETKNISPEDGWSETGPPDAFKLLYISLLLNDFKIQYPMFCKQFISFINV